MPPYSKRRRASVTRTRKSRKRTKRDGWVTTLASTRRLDPYARLGRSRAPRANSSYGVVDFNDQPYVPTMPGGQYGVGPEIYVPPGGGHAILNPTQSMDPNATALVPYVPTTTLGSRNNKAIRAFDKLPDVARKRIKKRVVPLRRRSARILKQSGKQVALRKYGPAAMKRSFLAKVAARDRSVVAVSGIGGTYAPGPLITLNEDGTVTTTGPITIDSVTGTIAEAVDEVVSEYGESGKDVLKANMAAAITVYTGGMVTGRYALGAAALAVNFGWGAASDYLSAHGYSTHNILSSAANGAWSVASQFIAVE